MDRAPAAIGRWKHHKVPVQTLRGEHVDLSTRALTKRGTCSSAFFGATAKGQRATGRVRSLARFTLCQLCRGSSEFPRAFLPALDLSDLGQPLLSPNLSCQQVSEAAETS